MRGVGSSDSVVGTVQPGWLMFSLIFNNHLIPLNTNKVFQSTQLFMFVFIVTCFSSMNHHQALLYRGADKSLARPVRKQATATEDFEFHIFYL